MSLVGKKILVVGGGSGIGRATAEQCVQHGGTVIIADIDQAAGSTTADELHVKYLPVNVSDEASVSAMYTALDAEFGRLDVLLHTAGIMRGAYTPIDDFTLDTWRSVIDTNMTGSFLCSKYAVPLLRKAGGGVIVLVSSMAAIGGSSSFAYGTSKGGVNGLGITLAQKLEPEHIRVNVVMPGNINTEMKRSIIAAQSEKPDETEDYQSLLTAARLGEPDGVARVLAWLASDDADYVRGMISTR